MITPQIRHSNYSMRVEIRNMDDIRHKIQGVYFELYTIRRQYSEFQLGLSYSFVSISLMTSLCFFYNYLQIPKELRIIEQHYINLLSFALIWLNGPIKALNVYFKNKVSVSISVQQMQSLRIFTGPQIFCLLGIVCLSHSMRSFMQ